MLLLVLWVPREHNELADYLSNLSCYVSRENVSGCGSQLKTIIQQSYPRNNYKQQTQEYGRYGKTIQNMVYLKQI